MRYFKVYTGRYGGELTIGRITSELYEQFIDSDEYDIIDHFNDWDNDIAWHDIDDIEHLNGPYCDNQYYVQEEDYAGEEIGDELGPFEYNQLYTREAYLYDVAAHAKRPEGAPPPATPELQPVLQFFSEEKGGFGEICIETEGDFDPEKLYVGICETDVAMLIDAYFYDRVQIEPDFDNADTIGKGYRAIVGQMNMKWHDPLDQVDLDEFFSYLDDEQSIVNARKGNPVAKYSRKFNKAVVMCDKKKAKKSGYLKHKKQKR